MARFVASVSANVLPAVKLLRLLTTFPAPVRSALPAALPVSTLAINAPVSLIEPEDVSVTPAAFSTPAIDQSLLSFNVNALARSRRGWRPVS